MGDSWAEYQKLILKSLSDLEELSESLRKDIVELKIKLAGMAVITTILLAWIIHKLP